MKILFLAANPQGTASLQLDEEIKRIDDGLRRSKLRQQFQLVSKWAVDSTSLRRALLEEQPDIVHFSGHGEGIAGLVLVGQDGKAKPATAAALAGLFKISIIAQKVKCVLLNACYAEEQARAIVQHIDYVIGMRQAIRDDAAIAFATGFYDGLGYDLSIEDAFELGCNAIQFELASFSNTVRSRHLIPVEFEKAEFKEGETSDHCIPVLLKRSQLVEPSPPSVSTPPHDTALSEKLRTSEATSRSANFKQYQEQVRDLIRDHQLTTTEIFQLAILANRFGLTEVEANRILEEEQNRAVKKASGIYPVPPPEVPAPISEETLNVALSHSLSCWQKIVSSLPEDESQVRVELFRSYSFPSFLEAIRFMNQLALDCEFSMHHPRWENLWRTVNVYLTSWDIKHHISDRDIQLAKAFDRAFQQFPDAARSPKPIEVYPTPPPEVPTPISEEALQVALSHGLSNWKKVVSPLPEDKSQMRVEILRQYRFKSFLDAIEFMNQLAPRCESAMHHPRWENIWRTVKVYFTTWDIGHRISDRDIQLAKAFDQAFAQFSGANQKKG